jgi:hypothetical protein
MCFGLFVYVKFFLLCSRSVVFVCVPFFPFSTIYTLHNSIFFPPKHKKLEHSSLWYTYMYIMNTNVYVCKKEKKSKFHLCCVTRLFVIRNHKTPKISKRKSLGINNVLVSPNACHVLRVDRCVCVFWMMF